MSWTLTIGEARIRHEPWEGRLDLVVDEVIDNDAPLAPPAFDPALPSRSNCAMVRLNWLEPFTLRVGLHPMFYGGWDRVPLFRDGLRGLVAGNRTIAPLSLPHLQEIREAMSVQASRAEKGVIPPRPDDPVVLAWLEFWTARALRCCAYPAMHSSG